MGTAIRILLVDDHVDTLQFMSRALSGAGYSVTSASTFKTAVEAVENANFDVVLSDVTLPDGDGCDLLQQIQTIREVKAIAISGWEMPGESERTRKGGFFTYLLKPVTIDEVIEAIEQALQFGNATPGLSQLHIRDHLAG